MLTMKVEIARSDRGECEHCNLKLRKQLQKLVQQVQDGIILNVLPEEDQRRK